MDSPKEYLKKTEAFTQRLEDDREFLLWVKKMRKKHSIEVQELKDYFEGVIIDCKNKNCKKHTWCELSNNKILYSDVDNYINEKLGVSPFWNSSIIDYLATDDFVLNENLTEIDTVDLFGRLLDCFEEDENLFEDKHRHEELGELSMRPIALRFSPYTTQTDLVNYIKKHFKETIQPLQSTWVKEGISFGKKRKKSIYIQERNDFIFKNRHLSIKELTKLLNDKYKPIMYDYAYVSKILSGQKRKRI